MTTTYDETDAVIYVYEAMRGRLATLATLIRVADGEADDLDCADVALELGEDPARIARERDADDDLAEAARERLDELPVCVESGTVHEIVLGTGGPDDRFLIYVEGDQRSWEITRIEYRYSWSGSGECSLSGEDYELVERFARTVVPELIESAAGKSNFASRPRHRQ